MRILLDTSVLIDAMRAHKRRQELLAQLVREGHELCTTALNVAEVYAGMRPHEQPDTDAFLEGLACFAIDRALARMGGHLKAQWARKGSTIAIVDCSVAAAAIRHDCALATDNRKHFPMPELSLYPLP